MNLTVYLTVYVGRWPEDEFEIGGVYKNKAEAEAVGKNSLTQTETGTTTT